MRDIHSHLIYGIDDGCTDFEQSISLLKKAKEVGFKEMVLTPHYFPQLNYVANNEIKVEKFKTIKQKCDFMKLHLGNEVFLSDNILELLKKDEISTIKKSKYILIEFPFDIFFPIFLDYIDELIKKGLVPILAHPERYVYYQSNLKEISELKKRNVLLQCNYGSIIGLHGRKAKACVKKLLKMDVVDIFSLDLHQDDTVLNKFETIKKKIIKLSSFEKFKLYSDTNISKILKSDIINYK